MLFEIGEYTVDTSQYAIRRGGDLVAVEPQVFDLILLLIRNRDRLVTKGEIFERIWKGRAVSDAALSSRVKAARKVFGDDGKSQRLIRTLHGRGFQFIGVVVEREAAARAVPPPVPAREPRCKVAVLPLRNIGGGPRLDMLALGIIEDVTTYLARVPGFLVISPYSTLRLADAEPREASERLAVRYIVDGSVTATNERARVSVRLIDAEAGAHVWGEEIERGLEELSDLSRHFAREILRRLEPELTRIELARLSARLPKSLDAWSLFRRAQGTLMFKPWTGDTFAEVARLLEEAVEREQQFALGHALYALSEALSHMAGFSDQGTRARVLKSAEEALRLDEHSSAVLGLCRLRHRRCRRARARPAHSRARRRARSEQRAGLGGARHRHAGDRGRGAGRLVSGARHPHQPHRCAARLLGRRAGCRPVAPRPARRCA